MKSFFTYLTWFVFLLSGVALISACRGKRTTVVAESKPELWTCSMHPEIIKDKPGTCPICGMDLVRKEENSVAIRGIQLGDLLQPTDRFVITAIPVIVPAMTDQTVEIPALGHIAYDTRLVSTLSAKVAGRIEKLYVKYRYQHVVKGQRIMDIYSPELMTTQQELLFLLKNDRGNSSLINAARQRLLLSGVSEGQLRQIIENQKPSLTIAVYSNASGHIHEAGSMATTELPAKMAISLTTEELIVKEGMYIQRGQPVFQLYNADMNWVLLNILPGYQHLVKKGNAVSIIPETAPGLHFRGNIDFIEPFYRKENKTLTARVYFNNAQAKMPVGSQVRATIFSKSATTSWLPSASIISLGIDNIVFVKMMSGFKAQKVQTGLRYKNQVEILSGIALADSVAVNAQFLADSESFIKVKDQP